LVVLIDLCEPYRGAFAASSRESGFDCEPVAGTLCVDTVVALLRSGVSDVIGLPAPVSDVVARASRDAAPNASFWRRH
jgi:hypothetical protein